MKMKFVILICLMVVLAFPLTGCSNPWIVEGTVPYDPKIECDLAELIWEYAKKLMPSRNDFLSVYDAVNLDKCNVSKYTEARPIENVLKKRYACLCFYLLCNVSRSHTRREAVTTVICVNKAHGGQRNLKSI